MAEETALLDAPAAAPEAATSEIPGSADGGVGGEAAAEATSSGSSAPAAAAADSAAGEAPRAPEPVEIEFPEEGAEGDEAAAPEAAEPGAEAATDQTSARFGTAALTKLLKDQPELAAAAEANPRIRAQLYQMARRSQDLGKYQELLPSLGRAQEAAQAAETLANYDRAYFGSSPEQFWQGLYQAQLGQDGRSSGVYERNVQFLHQVFLDRLQQQAQQSGDDSLSGAVRSIRETLGWGNSRSPYSPAQGGQQRAIEEDTNLPPQIRQRLEQADHMARELEQLRTRRSEEARQATEHFLDETATEAGRELRGFVDGILAQAKLSDYDKQNIARDFLERVSELADQDQVHNAALDELLRSGGATPQTRAQMVARVKAWARQNGRDILEPILQRAGAGLKQRQQQRQAAQARQRSEPAAIGAPARPTQLSARDLVKSAESKLGRRLTDREILEMA